MEYIYHFCYGSNMHYNRIKNNCPSAKRITKGYIKNYRFDFGNHFSKNWNGYVATIVPEKKSITWGNIWKIKSEEIKTLDDQESVYKNVYNTLYVPVHIKDKIVYCYCYQLVDLPIKNNNNKPSESYLNTIINGAIESELPNFYIQKLKKYNHNNQKSKFDFPKV